MALVLSSVENEVKSRARSVGAFTAAQSVERLRYSILRAAMTLANLRDWDYLNQQDTITTSAGNYGPYNLPTGFLRLATHKAEALFGFVDKDKLAPILATDTKIYTPYFLIASGQVSFFSDPGSGDLTLNYHADITDDITEGVLGATIAIIPNGLKPSLVDYALADIYGDLPSADNKVAGLMTKARSSAEDYWHQSTLAVTQRGIAPKGLNGVSIDNHATHLTIVGLNTVGWILGSNSDT